jgi:hypothetical protein
VLLDALLLLADTESLLLSSEKDELVCQVVDDIVTVGVKLLNVELFDAVMAVELTSGILFVADLAHDLYLWAISLDVVVELGSGQVLELLSVADVASELGALELSVTLELSKSLPDDLTALSCLRPASVRELTEVNTVSQDFVDFLQEVSSSLAVRAAEVKLWSDEHFLDVLLSLSLSSTDSTSCVETFLTNIIDDIALSID